METQHKLDAVYAKWERKAQPGKTQPRGEEGVLRTQYNNLIATSQKVWNNRFSYSDDYPSSHQPSHNWQDNRSRQNNKRRRGNQQQSFNSLDVDPSSAAFFKTRPTILPIATQHRRSFTARCCICMPESRESLYKEDMEIEGVKNIFDLDTKFSSNLMTRIFYNVAFCSRVKCDHKYADVIPLVLQNPRLKEAIQRTALHELGFDPDADIDKSLSSVDVEEFKKRCQRLDKRTAKMAHKMKSQVSTRLVRCCLWILHHMMNYLFDKIIVNKSQIEMIEKTMKSEYPPVFLPLHKSHMDYILIHFILATHGLPMPHIAAGDNLLIPLFKTLARGLGAFFIRRRIDPNHSHKDFVYRSLLQTYVTELLRSGESVEVFLEGGRSRSGKPLYPKAGLLSIIVDAFKQGDIPDAHIVPVSIGYEKIVEGSYTKEQMGGKKVVESFFNAVRGTINMFRSQYGNVRVDFGQPFSLKEFLKVAEDYTTSSSFTELGGPESSGSIIRLRGSNTSLLNGTSDEYRLQIQTLGEHVIYSCMMVQAVMSTPLVAFLLLTKHRSGVTLSALEHSVDWLREEVALRRRDVGCCGDARDIILHACRVLGASVEVEASNKQLGDLNNNEARAVIIKPKTCLPHVLELSYCANALTPSFALEGIVATAVCVEVGDCLWVKQGMEENRGIRFRFSTIKQRVLQLCEILQYEFIFKPPCMDWDTALKNAFETLVISEFLSTAQDNEGGGRRSYAFEDEDGDQIFGTSSDVEYKVNLTSKYGLERVCFLTKVTAPYLEAYHIIVCNLCLIRNDTIWQEETFIARMLNILTNRVKSGISQYAEATSMDLVKNAVQSLKHSQILDSWKDGKRHMLLLQDSDASKVHRKQMLDNLEACRIIDLI